MAINNFIDRIKIGNSEGEIAIGSSAYGECSTAAGTKAKTVDIPGFALNKGTTIHVKFIYANTASDPTLNVNNTGDIPLRQYGTTAMGGTASTTGWNDNAVLTLTYDGSGWIRDQGYNTNSTYTITSVWCNTAAATAAKTFSNANYYTANNKSYFEITFRYANSAQSALTLNGKTLYINGMASSASNYTIPAGKYLVYYDNNIYYIRTDGKITGDITGDAATVNGLTVATAVPANAIFTDTNKYHKSGTWSGLTYTATAVNSADELKFTIPDNYGDTKNPYSAKGKNLVLAGPSSGNNAAPSFRALVAADIPDIGGTYLKLTGGTMTGSINLVGNQNSAYNDKGLIFTQGSRIGENNNGGLGIYAAERIYLRPDSPTSSSGDGIEISGSGIIPSNNNTETLGDSSHKWSNVYATNLNGNLSVTAHTNTTDGTKSYYPWFGTATSGNLGPRAYAGVYIFETVSNGAISQIDMCMGKSGIKGTFTVWNGTHWANIAANTLTANRNYLLSDRSGTIALITDTDMNALINTLNVGSSDVRSSDYIITQYAGTDTNYTNTYYRRQASKVVNATLVKAALGTVSTTAKKFLKDTGTWAQVAWDDLSGIPSTFTPSSHEHNYIGKDHYIAYPSDGTYEGSGTVTGYIKIKIPETKSSTMFSFDVDIYNYVGDTTTRYHIAGYNYNNASWNNCTAYCIAPFTNVKANLPVRFLSNGNDEMYITIGETDTSWSYPKVTIHNIALGHSNATLAKWKSGWTTTISNDAFDNTQIKRTITNTNIADSVNKAAAANLTTTANAIAYYTDTIGTFDSKASADGALYATSANGSLQWGTLPIAQGGTGATTANNAANALISGLPTWTAAPTADTYFIRRDTGGSAAFGQVKFSSIANITNGKITLGPYSITPVTSVNGHTGSSVSVTAGDLGLSSALRYQGTTTTVMSDGLTTAKVKINNADFTPSAGDVVIYNDAEYLWTGSLWELIGAESSFKKVQTAISSSSASGNSATTFVSSVTQDTQGVITVKTSTLNTSGTWSGNAATATAIQTAGTTAQFYRGDNTWSNIIKRTANATLGIDTNLKIGTAIKDLHFSVGSGSGTGINDGNAGGITIGTDTASYGGIYWQSSGSYGLRLHFATTGSFANGAYTRMLITHDGKVGIGTLNPDTLLTVNGNAKATKFIGALQGNADTATAANLTTTTNAIAYYTNATGTFGSKASADGVLYATSTNGELQWGTLPIAQGGTGVTTEALIRATYGIEYITGTQTASTNAWTGVTSSAALYAGKTIAYYLPYAGTSTAATLNLTLSGGTTTGAKNVRINNSNVTTHFPAGTVILLVYDGTYWKVDNYDSNSNTLLRVYASATNLDVPLIGQSSANSVTAAWTSYTGTYKDWYGAIPNNDTLRAKINLSTGHITAPGGITTSALHVGTADSYGDAYTPIYWNDGVPSKVTTILKENFTLGTSSMSAAATVTTTISNNTSASSQVVQIVVTDGMSNLHSTIEWQINSSNQIQLSATTQKVVSGYILYIK